MDISESNESLANHVGYLVEYLMPMGGPETLHIEFPTDHATTCDNWSAICTLYFTLNGLQSAFPSSNVMSVVYSPQSVFLY